MTGKSRNGEEKVKLLVGSSITKDFVCSCELESEKK